MNPGIFWVHDLYKSSGLVCYQTEKMPKIPKKSQICQTKCKIAQTYFVCTKKI